MPEHVYAPADRPLVEVQIGDEWFPGELRGWWDRGGHRLMNVSWSRDHQTYIDTVGAERVRAVDVSTDPPGGRV